MKRHDIAIGSVHGLPYKQSGGLLCWQKASILNDALCHKRHCDLLCLVWLSPCILKYRVPLSLFSENNAGSHCDGRNVMWWASYTSQESSFLLSLRSRKVLCKKVLFQNLSIASFTDQPLCCRWFKKMRLASAGSCIRQSAHAESVMPLRVSFLVKNLNSVIVSRGSVYSRAVNYDMLYLVCSYGQCCMMQACGIVYGVPGFCSASLIAFLEI